MDNYQIIANHFHSAIEMIALSADELAGNIEQASNQLIAALIADAKILVCGNGSDGAIAQLFVTSLMAQYDSERPPLPAIALGCDPHTLTAITQTSNPDDIYARQLRALGQPGDILLCIASHQTSNTLKMAIDAAHERNMQCILLSNGASELLELVSEQDTAIEFSCSDRATTLELQLMTLNAICKLIDNGLFGSFSTE
ncbi:MAG: SIS domain-containing protein [Gammaproteobacteria bacterium]|nr:SIS domain-containing protein [Gammaproteobacteria bacterium]